MENFKKISGIVVEYNPFHNGHIYHIRKARELAESDVLIAIMSGNFVQRGEPSIIDKWTRTQLALDHGVDIVLELPVQFTLQAAPVFASKAIAGLALVGVNQVIYGSETSQEHPQSFNAEKIKQGYSYAASFENKLAPNDILAHYYRLACAQHAIQSIAIKRTNAYHDLNISGSIASASAIRHAHFQGLDTSQLGPSPLDKLVTHRLKDYESLIKYQLITCPDLTKIQLVDEGIENLLLKNINLDLDRLIEASISRRYTRSRIQRTLTNILLDIKKEELDFPQVRVLGMNETGQAYLASIKKQARFTTQFKHYHFKDSSYQATQIYALPYPAAYQNKLIYQELQGPLLKTAKKEEL